jgi:putative tryptophan/tyrosine transport system substrate-binding protein
MGSGSQRGCPVGDPDWVIFNPETGPYYTLFLPFVEMVSRQLNVEPIPTAIHDANSIEQILEKLAEVPSTGVVVFPSALFSGSREIIISTVGRLRVPTVYPYSFFAQSGGLLSYGFDVADMYQRAASYVDRILQGTKVSDLPAQLPTKVELVINLKTARVLGLTVPSLMLSRADEVIE